ncbi:MAG: shikimate dehydrogenase [Chloroflexi bacterium]|nr:shikimate dehydrogenase [Chloroflexota bacterium]
MSTIHDDTFAFIFHPINIKRDVIRKYPFWGRVFGEAQINFLSRFFPPVYISQIDGITSQHHSRQLTGWFIAAPYTPQVMMSLPPRQVYNKIVDCGEMAMELGAKILGLGAYTSVVGDGGVTIAERLEIPVTTGDSYTVYIAVQAVREAAKIMDIPVPSAKTAVVGATGAIGGACAEMLAGEVAHLVLIGRREEALEVVEARCSGGRATVVTSTDVKDIYDADLILTVTSATHAVIEPEHIKPGAVVCDVARPRDVSQLVYEKRDDVLVFEGGMIDVPGDVQFNFDFGFPPGKAFACMAETMALALEGLYGDYTLGKHITTERCVQIGHIAEKHGFRLSGFRSFEKAVSEAHIDSIREKARENRLVWAPEF